MTQPMYGVTASFFLLDAKGAPTVVAGVPPDYFTTDGQLWGNPHYDWDAMAWNGYQWWIERFKTTFELFDIVRVDHFRGFEAAWQVPANARTARNGRWVEGPGEKLFAALHAALGPLPIIAEDLGVITSEVEALRDRFNLPGMKILQFAFDSGPSNPYLPHNYINNIVVYTGTHDNDTTRGWYDSISDAERREMNAYLGSSGDDCVSGSLPSGCFPSIPLRSATTATTSPTTSPSIPPTAPCVTSTAAARGPRPGHQGDHRTGHQPHLRPASLVPEGPQRRTRFR
jgi:4-alpha-glucanotransferase